MKSQGEMRPLHLGWAPVAEVGDTLGRVLFIVPEGCQQATCSCVLGWEPCSSLIIGPQLKNAR